MSNSHWVWVLLMRGRRDQRNIHFCYLHGRFLMLLSSIIIKSAAVSTGQPNPVSTCWLEATVWRVNCGPVIGSVLLPVVLTGKKKSAEVTCYLITAREQDKKYVTVWPKKIFKRMWKKKSFCPCVYCKHRCFWQVLTWHRCDGEGPENTAAPKNILTQH